jgi:ABC-2 type transport system ATP-binding protein
MKEILKELRSMGKTILISSHILSELAEVCTSIGILGQGRMIVSGTVEEIMKKISRNKTVRIKVLGDIEPAVRFLQEQPSLDHVYAGNDRIEADYDGDPGTLADILRGMVKNEIPVISFGEVEGSLESIFMQVTGGEIGNAG